MWDWAVAVVGLVSLIYWYLTRHYSYWRALGVYTPPGVVPGAGHLWEAAVLKRSAVQLHCEIYHKTKGHPAVGFYSFREPVLLLRDLNLIQTVLISEFSSFHDNMMDVDEKIDPYVARNPFVTKGQRWKTLRQQLSPAFSSARIKVMFPLIQRVCQEFNTYMEGHQNDDVNVNRITGLFTSEVVAKVAFGLDGNAFTNPNAEFYQQGRKIWDGSIYNPFKMLIFVFFPFINKFLKKGIFSKEVVEFFVNLIKQVAEHRTKNPDKAPDNDYLQFLLNLNNKNPDFTLDDVVAQTLTFFTDGFETSSSFASFILYELTVNPDIQEAVRKEVKSMESFNYDNIISLPLLDRVTKETIRKYSPFSFVKVCTKDFVLQADGQSFPVTKGQKVVIPVYGIHHDPDIYPEPDKFEPKRFLPENVNSRHPLTYLGFGAGPRICIGNRFAMAQVKIMIAYMVTNFRLLRCEKTVQKIRLLPQHSLPVPEGGIWIKFQKI